MPSAIDTTMHLSSRGVPTEQPLLACIWVRDTAEPSVNGGPHFVSCGGKGAAANATLHTYQGRDGMWQIAPEVGARLAYAVARSPARHPNTVRAGEWLLPKPPDGEWLPVPVDLPNAIVLNGGTVLQRLTGGRWKAAIHRAARANPHERLSIVYGAMVPHNDLELSSLAVADLGTAMATAATAGRPVVKVKDYLDARVRMQRPETDPRDSELIAYVDGEGGRV